MNKFKERQKGELEGEEERKESREVRKIRKKEEEGVWENRLGK